MAVTVEKGGDWERGPWYEIALSANGDVAQAHLIAEVAGASLDWLHGRVGWWKSANVDVTFTNAGPDAMAVSGGNGVLAGWVDHPDNAATQAAETLPITGLRFTATAASQSVILYTGNELADDPVDAGTPA